MSDPLLIYGATGYSGRLITEAAVALGLAPVLSARNRDALAAVAAAVGLECRVAELSEPNQLDEALRGITVVLHAAGPFSQTSPPMLEACLRCHAHYLDITGEISVIESLVHANARARSAGIMVMPAVGFDVVPSDCMAAHVTSRLPGASSLVLALTGLVSATPGSAKTLVEQAGHSVRVRRGGKIASIAAGSVSRWFDYGDGPRCSMNISWGDVASAFYTTGIPNIDVFYEATPALRGMLLASRYASWMLRSAPWQASLAATMNFLPQGPTDAQRAAAQMVIVAEARDDRGRCARARLRTPEAYTFTATTAAAVARRVLRGDLEIGFQTPARVYGADWVLSFANV
ncbi:MAG TPA: NAD(P)H-binding protein, partial [Candidatus Binatia bacterium]|nr:NAD(P)H-binding protein [Candidatus Binatia bacterium]